ncbi:hypothetical protein CCH79_00020811, partial [Gambusia affinis]
MLLLLCVLIFCGFRFVMSEEKLISVDFEIFGNVQDTEEKNISVLQYTEDQGRALGLGGWVKNTRQGTVIGQIQGPAQRVNS